MQTIPIHLCFKGQRNYLHGTDMYSAIIEHMLNYFPKVNIDAFHMSIHNTAGKQCNICICDNGDTSSKPDNVVTDFSFKLNKGDISGWLVERSELIKCRIPCNEDVIKRQCEINVQTITHYGKSKHSSIEIAVSMTKQLHQFLYPIKSGKWMFTRLDLQRLLKPEDGQQLHIELKHNLNNRLTKSNINVSGKTIGHIYFSLVMTA